MAGTDNKYIALGHFINFRVQNECARAFGNEIDARGIDHSFSGMPTLNRDKQRVKTGFHFSGDILLAREATCVKGIGVFESNFSGDVFHECKYSKLWFQTRIPRRSLGLEPNQQMEKLKQIKKASELEGLSICNNALAGAAGFEPAYHGTKTRCLTTWLRPTVPATDGRTD